MKQTNSHKKNANNISSKYLFVFRKLNYNICFVLKVGCYFYISLIQMYVYIYLIWLVQLRVNVLTGSLLIKLSYDITWIHGKKCNTKWRLSCWTPLHTNRFVSRPPRKRSLEVTGDDRFRWRSFGVGGMPVGGVVECVGGGVWEWWEFVGHSVGRGVWECVSCGRVGRVCGWWCVRVWVVIV